MTITNGKFTFRTFSNIVISLSGGFLSYGIARYFKLQFAIEYGVVVACLCWLIYTLQLLLNLPKNVKLHRYLLVFNIATCIFSVLICILQLFICFQDSICLFVVSLFFAFLCVWYLIPVFGKKLRDIPGLKTFVNALVWSYACVFFPLTNEGVSLHTTFCLSLLVFAYFIAIILPFDIRDMHSDSRRQKTIPQLIGKRLSKILASGLLLTVFVGFSTLESLTINNFLLTIAIFLQLVLLLLAHENRPSFYFVLVDLSIVWLGLAFLYSV